MTDALAEQRDLRVRDDESDTLIELGALAFDYPEAGDPQYYYRQALIIARNSALWCGKHGRWLDWAAACTAPAIRRR